VKESEICALVICVVSALLPMRSYIILYYNVSWSRRRSNGLRCWYCRPNQGNPIVSSGTHTRAQPLVAGTPAEALGAGLRGLSRRVYQHVCLPPQWTYRMIARGMKE
jgi:hypothetical protein